MNRTAALVGVSTMVAGAAFTMAMPAAHAATARNGVCESGEFCLYYNSNEAGSVSDFNTSISDYGATQPGCYEFKGSGAGQGLCVKNQAASVWNRTGKTVYVYYNSGYAGSKQSFGAGVKGNLNATLKNNNAAHHIGAFSGGAAQSPVNDYPYRNSAADVVDRWNFYTRECTSFAAWRLHNRDGINFSNSYKGQHWGNAGHWYTAAKAAGISVNRTPKVGAIAVNTVHKVGHVAYIEKVYSDGSFDVEEYNWGVVHGYTARRHISGLNSADGGFQYAIHF
ncbi:CHAP domain-containing protein [Flexivirga lutea]